MIKRRRLTHRPGIHCLAQEGSEIVTWCIITFQPSVSFPSIGSRQSNDVASVLRCFYMKAPGIITGLATKNFEVFFNPAQIRLGNVLT